MLLDGHINVLTSGHLQDSTLQRVLVALEPLGYVDHGSVFGGQALEAGGAAAAFLAGLAALLRPSETNLFLMRFVGIALILDGIQNIIVAAITIYRKKTK